MKYASENIGLWINVGTAKNDGKNHIYTLTNKAEEAPTEYGVSRPVGNAIQSASSITSISESVKKINTSEKNNLEKSSNERFALSVEPGDIAIIPKSSIIVLDGLEQQAQ